jgi:hypothetical protein
MSKRYATPHRQLAAIAPRNVRMLDLDMAAAQLPESILDDLRRLGIAMDASFVDQMQDYATAMDAFTPQLLTPSIGTPIQFLQTWLPGFVRIVTRARKIDELVGISTVGSWTDEEIVQGVMELTGSATLYGDLTNIPLSSWGANFERRTVVRFEEGLQVGKLEEGRAAAMRINSADAKREAAAEALEIERNKIGFYGYNNGENRTYGFLTDPNLPAYVSVADGAGGDTEWSTKTFLEITADIRIAAAALRTQSGDRINPRETEITLALPTDAAEFLSITSDFGNSVADWMSKTYPRMRVVSAPELSDANGGENVFYMYAETVADSGTDDQRTFVQMVPTKFMTLGVEQRAKTYLEDFTNATAGVLLKRPYAVVRYTGI